MKNNTERSKHFLLQAIQNMPDDFALSTARQQMKSALHEMQKIESRRESRENMNKAHELERLEKSIGVGVNYDARDALKMIDELIGQEKENLKSILERKQKEQLNDDDNDIQALLD